MASPIITAICHGEGNNKSFSLLENESVLSCALKESLYIKTSCGGVGRCSDCIVKVVAGEENCPPPSFAETNLLGNVFHLTRERLSCQLYPQGDITIDIREHDSKRDEKNRKNKATNFTPAKKHKIISAKEVSLKQKRWEEESDKEQKKMICLGKSTGKKNQTPPTLKS